MYDCIIYILYYILEGMEVRLQLILTVTGLVVSGQILAYVALLSVRMSGSH